MKRETKDAEEPKIAWVLPGDGKTSMFECKPARPLEVRKTLLGGLRQLAAAAAARAEHAEHAEHAAGHFGERPQPLTTARRGGITIISYS